MVLHQVVTLLGLSSWGLEINVRRTTQNAPPASLTRCGLVRVGSARTRRDLMLDTRRDLMHVRVVQ